LPLRFDHKLVSSFLDLGAMRDKFRMPEPSTISSRMYSFADVKQRLNQALVKNTG
jgi:hypothetical protein